MNLGKASAMLSNFEGIAGEKTFKMAYRSAAA